MSAAARAERPDDAVAALERENRILKRKLARSEDHRRRLEDFRARNEAHLMEALARGRETQRTLEEANAELQRSLDQLRAAQDELVRSERLAELGRLVAGVAHEINTPLGVAVTGSSLTRERLETLRQDFEQGTLRRKDLRRFLDDAETSTELVEVNLRRAAELVTHFKKVAVDQTSQVRRTISLVAYLDDVLTSLGPMLRKTGVTARVLSEKDVRLDTFPGALSQVITNLVSNAVHHAYPEGAVGEVRFVVRPFSSGGASLEVEDDGRGMPPEVLRQIFEPFFTTRRAQGGSGLGMHIVHNLVTSVLGGHITVRSRPGGGTRILIELPARPAGEEG
ncbi:MAG: HAMP domain-containing histidine kinase [Alphaproteobacteria bacterium]|nr:HAMP domain-containing histidine kinase [Alphaproteobacteria bacterium]